MRYQIFKDNDPITRAHYGVYRLFFMEDGQRMEGFDVEEIVEGAITPDRSQTQKALLRKYVAQANMARNFDAEILRERLKRCHRDKPKSS